MYKKLPNTSESSEGFTLVELLVVVAIIAILAAVGITIFSGAQKGARDAKRKAEVDMISKAYETHYGDTSCSATSSNPYCIPSASWFSGNTIPVDPSTAANYLWNGVTTVPSAVRSTYTICADLEVSTGNSSTVGDGTSFTSATNGGYYCQKNQQ